MNMASTARAMEAGIKEVKLPVPHVSQRLEVGDWNEPQRSCGMVCVYMALLYYKERGLLGNQLSEEERVQLLQEGLPSLDYLIAQGRDNGGLVEGAGWVHDYLVNTFRTYGISCRRDEKMDPERTMPLFARIIESCGDPVLVSTQYVRFGENDKLTHFIILTGVRYAGDGSLDGFFFHEPNVYKEGQGQHQFVHVDDFPTGWRRMAILPCTKMASVQ